jgi:hypothetical protein
MKTILATFAGALLIAAGASRAELPAAPAKSDAEKASEAQKASAAKAKDAADLGRAQDKAVTNYKKNKGDASAARKPDASSSSGSTSKPKPAEAEVGADHSESNPPEKDLTREEAQTKMPTPGQANDHSSTERETVPSGR